jgi:hypothetical protein
MTAETPRPPHPLPALTTYELRDYRKLLEYSLSDGVIGSAPIAADVRARLDQVLAEQETRQRIRHSERRGPVGL